jgi:hypothetical protein
MTDREQAAASTADNALLSVLRRSVMRRSVMRRKDDFRCCPHSFLALRGGTALFL